MNSSLEPDVWGGFEIPNRTQAVHQHKELDLKNRVQAKDGANKNEHEEAKKEHREVVYPKLAFQVDPDEQLTDCFSFPMESEAFARESICR